MEEHEILRARQIERLKATIDNKIQDKDIKDTFYETVDTFSVMNAGIDEAHKRLDIRKDDINKLSDKMESLTRLVQLSVKESIENNKKTARNSKISLITNLAAVTFSLFLVFGGAEALKQLGYILTAIKAINILV